MVCPLLLRDSNSTVFDLNFDACANHRRFRDFKNTVIILTSNIGSQYLLDGITADGEIKEGARLSVIKDLRSHFRPEFLNRVDEIVLFKPLTVKEITKIVDLLLNEVRSRLKDRNIKIEITDKAKKFIANSGYDPVYGARPLKRYIQRELETRIGRSLIADEVSDGSLISIDIKDGALSIQTAQVN